MAANGHGFQRAIVWASFDKIIGEFVQMVISHLWEHQIKYELTYVRRYSMLSANSCLMVLDSHAPNNAKFSLQN